MQIKDIINERKLQRVQTMYHGTSSTQIPGILKHGLLAAPPKTTYSRESGVDSPGYDTFTGGVYITSNIDKAEDGADIASNTHGGNPVMITLQYVINSGNIDEDDVSTILVKSIISHVPESVKSVAQAAKYFSNREYFNATVDNVVKDFYNPANLDLSDYVAKPNNITVNKHGVGAIKKLASATLSYILTASSNEFSFDEFMDFALLDEIRHIPEFESAMYEVLPMIKPISSDTVRVTRNIGFKGKTRIISIVDLVTGKVYYGAQSSSVDNTSDNTWYFFGNPSKEYAWGSGKTPTDALADAKQGFEDWMNYEPNSDHTWNDELRVCKLYQTDQHTHDMIQLSGIIKLIKQGNLYVAA